MGTDSDGGTPTAERVVQVLDFLTTHPQRGFKVSELSRRLHISRTTTYKILTTLSRRALVLRNETTLEYRLGPALVAMGSIGERNFPALTHAKRESEQLAAMYDSECVVVMAIHDELLVVGRAGVAGPLSMPYVEGQRQPLAPPFGTSFIAWTGDDAVEAWLDRLGEELTQTERDHYRAVVASARRHGYTVSIRGELMDEFARLHDSADLYTPTGRRELSRMLAALAHDEGYLPEGDDLPPNAYVNLIAAPVFDSDGTMLLGISLRPNERYRARDTPKLAREVLHAAARVTAAVGGRRPVGNRAPGSAPAHTHPSPVVATPSTRRDRSPKAKPGRARSRTHVE